MRFYIGHPAYRGLNKFEVAVSKSHAIRILRERGVTRDIARDTINKAVKGEWTFCSPNLSNIIIEVLLQKEL